MVTDRPEIFTVGELRAAGHVQKDLRHEIRDNLLAALAAAGGRPEQLASLTVYIVDMDDYRSRAREVGAVWRRLVGRDYPAMAGIGVSRLWDAEALVELQGVAVLP